MNCQQPPFTDENNGSHCKHMVHTRALEMNESESCIFSICATAALEWNRSVTYFLQSFLGWLILSGDIIWDYHTHLWVEK